jgi:hypothetical protein
MLLLLLDKSANRGTYSNQSNERLMIWVQHGTNKRKIG